VPSGCSSLRTCTSSFLEEAKRESLPRVLLAVIEPSLIGQAVRSLALESSKSDASPPAGRFPMFIGSNRGRATNDQCPARQSFPPPNGHGFGVALPFSMEYRDNIRGGDRPIGQNEQTLSWSCADRTAAISSQYKRSATVTNRPATAVAQTFSVHCLPPSSNDTRTGIVRLDKRLFPKFSGRR